MEAVDLPESSTLGFEGSALGAASFCSSSRGSVMATEAVEASSVRDESSLVST